MSLLRSSLSLLGSNCIRYGFAASYSSIKFTDTRKIMKAKRMKITRPVDAYLLDLSVPPSELLSKLKPHDELRLQQIKEEHRMLLNRGERYVPPTLEDKDLVELLRGKNFHYRQHAYKKIFKRLIVKVKKAEKAAIRRLESAEEKQGESFGRRRALRNISFKAARQFYYARLFRELDFSQKIILDMSFEDEMRLGDMKSLCNQVLEVVSEVISARDPFHLVFSGMKRDSNQFVYLSKMFHIGVSGTHKSFSDFDAMPFTRTEDCALRQMTPEERKQVVYLTPDSNRILRRWDDSKTYVIGGLVDKVDTSPFTLLKARQLGVQHARLPLDELLEWRRGRKSLAIDIMLRILLTLKRTGDFNEAFKHIPSRFTNDLEPLRNRSKHNFL